MVCLHRESEGKRGWERETEKEREREGERERGGGGGEGEREGGRERELESINYHLLVAGCHNIIRMSHVYR